MLANSDTEDEEFASAEEYWTSIGVDEGFYVPGGASAPHTGNHKVTRIDF